MEKKLTKHEIKRIESDKRIISATIKVIGEKGYTNANFKEIAAEAGITPGLITQRFETKENLLIRTIDYTETIWRDDSMPADISLEVLLKSIITDMKADYLKDKNRFRFAYTVYSGTDIPQSVREKQKEFFYNSGLYALLKSGQDKGYLPEGDLERLYDVFVINTLRLVMDYSREGLTMPDDKYFMTLIQYKNPEDEEQQSLRNKAFESISKSFFSLVYCNISKGTYKIARTLDRIRECGKDTDNAQEFLYKACEVMIDPSDRDRVKDFLDLSTVMERIGNKKVIAIDFQSYNHVNHRFSFIIVNKEKDNEIILCGVQEIENN